MSDASMLEDLYHRDIIALARDGRQRGRLETPAYSARADNPVCGDRVTIDLAVHDARITAVGHRVRGCALCEAAAEILAREAVGAPTGDIAAARTAMSDYLRGGGGMLPWAQLSVFAPVATVASRHECVLLPFDAAMRALDT